MFSDFSSIITEPKLECLMYLLQVPQDTFSKRNTSQQLMPQRCHYQRQHLGIFSLFFGWVYSILVIVPLDFVGLFSIGLNGLDVLRTWPFSHGKERFSTKIYLHELGEKFLLFDGPSPLKPLKGNQISLIPRRYLRGSELKHYSLNITHRDLCMTLCVAESQGCGFSRRTYFFYNRRLNKSAPL